MSEQYEDPQEDTLPHETFVQDVVELEAALVRYKPRGPGAPDMLREFARDYFGPIVRRINECFGGSLDEVFDNVDQLQQQVTAIGANIGNVLAVAQASGLAEQLAHSVLSGAPAEQVKGLAEAYAAAVTATRVQLQALVEAMKAVVEEPEEEPPAEEAPIEATAPEVVEETPAPPPARSTIQLPTIPTAAAKA